MVLFAKFEFCRINKSCTKLPRSLTFSDNNNYAETSQAAASSAWNTTWRIWRRYSGSWSVSLKGTRSSLVFTILQKPFRLFIINIFFNKKNFPSWNLENILDNFFFQALECAVIMVYTFWTTHCSRRSLGRIVWQVKIMSAWEANPCVTTYHNQPHTCCTTCS